MWLESAWLLDKGLAYKVCNLCQVKAKPTLGTWFSPSVKWNHEGSIAKLKQHSERKMFRALGIGEKWLCRRKGHVLLLRQVSKGGTFWAKGRLQADPTSWPLSRLVGRQPLQR